jgi:uncharacterized protein YqjF (DUF2071 family)
MSEVGGIDRLAPTRRPSERVVMRQDWRHLLFLHWEVDPAALRALLPPGLTLDTYEGRAFVGLVPFTMRNVRPVWSPPLPWLSHFHEVNVRTYVCHERREPGVWFFSLDAANPVAVLAARALWKLPYFHARMSLKRVAGGCFEYRSERRWPKPVPAGCALRYEPTGTPQPSEVGTLEFFLAERYNLYSFDCGRLFRGRVHHAPYPLQPARLIDLDETLVRAASVTLPTASTGSREPLAHYAAGVNVDVFPLLQLTD